MTDTQRLSTLYYEVDETPHIEVDGEKCVGCDDHPCLTFCPARCFTPGENRSIDYYYVGCIECGTCLLLCNREAVVWNYPRGGYGVKYRF